MGSEDIYAELSKELDTFILQNLPMAAPVLASRNSPTTTSSGGSESQQQDVLSVNFKPQQTVITNPYRATTLSEYGDQVYTIKFHERDWSPQDGLKKEMFIGVVLRVMACQNMEVPATDSPAEFPYLACSYLEKVMRSKKAKTDLQYAVEMMFGDQMRAFKESFYRLQRDLDLQTRQYESGNFDPPPVTFTLPDELVLGARRSRYPIITIVPHGKMLKGGRDVDAKRRAKEELDAVIAWQDRDAALALEALNAHALKAFGKERFDEIQRRIHSQGHSYAAFAAGTVPSALDQPGMPRAIQPTATPKTRFDWVVSAPLSSLNYPFGQTF